MTNNDVIKVIEILGIESSTWSFNKDITGINIISDAVQNYDYFSQRLYFDTVAGVLKIKYYDFKIISTEFFNSQKTGDFTITIKPDFVGYYGKKYGAFDKLRNPLTNDIVYTVSKSTGNIVEATKIESISGNIVTLTENIDVGNDVFLCYAAGNLLTLESGVIDPTFDEMFLEVLENARNLLIRKPKTSYDSDIYISFDGLIGILLKRRIYPQI